jgi:hypothetical protein
MRQVFLLLAVSLDILATVQGNVFKDLKTLLITTFNGMPIRIHSQARTKLLPIWQVPIAP